MRTAPVRCAVLGSVMCLSPTASAHAQAFPNMSDAEARATADQAAANHAAAVRAAAAARAAALVPPPSSKLPQSKAPNQLSVHTQAFSNMRAAEVRAAADQSAANHAAAVRAAAARAAALVPPPPVKLPEFNTPEQLFTYARQLNDPEAAGTPFHLKASFVASGDTEFTGKGTYEEWWQSKDIWRKEATLGDYKYVAIHNGATNLASATSVYTPLRVWQAMNLQLFHLGQHNDQQPDWKLSKITEHNVSLLQLARGRPCSPEQETPSCRDQYVFAPSGILQSYAENDLSQTYTNPQPFSNLQLPRRVVLSLQGNPLLTLQIISVTPLSAGDQNLLDVKSIPQYAAVPARIFTGDIPDSVTLPKVLQRAPLQFPRSQRGHEHNSTVVTECLIDPTGNLREPFVKISGGTDYDQQALKSLRQWKFAPGTLDGQPIIVKTVIVTEFEFSVKK